MEKRLDSLSFGFGERGCIENNAATQRHHRRELPQDEAVSRQQKGWLGQTQPRHSLPAGSDLLAFSEYDFADVLHGLGVKMDSGAILQGLRGRQQGQGYVEPLGRAKHSCAGQGFASRQFLHCRPGEI